MCKYGATRRERRWLCRYMTRHRLLILHGSRLLVVIILYTVKTTCNEIEQIATLIYTFCLIFQSEMPLRVNIVGPPLKKLSFSISI